MKLPALQFYVGDWRKDPGVQALDYFTRGVWFEMICLMHESEERGKLLLNGRPMPDDALANVLHLDNQNLTKCLTKLFEFGVATRDATTGVILCRRMVRDEEIRKIRANCGKMGGNPKLLLKQKSTTQDKVSPTPSVSSSVSPSGTPLPPSGELLLIAPDPVGNGEPYCVVHNLLAAVSADSIYEAYPRKVAKPKALKSISRQMATTCPACLLEKTTRYCQMRQDSKDLCPSVPHPTTWFNQQRFNDDPETWKERNEDIRTVGPKRINNAQGTLNETAIRPQFKVANTR